MNGSWRFLNYVAKLIVEWRTNKDDIELEFIAEAAARYRSTYDYAASGPGYTRCSRLGAVD
jgi:hypothetical protein